MDKIDFLAEHALAWEEPLDAYLDWRMKTASGVLASRTNLSLFDLLPNDDGELDTEVHW